MTIGASLNKLMPVLTARERAILVLESWKAGDEEDPLWRSTMPETQTNQFNRLIELMNGSVLRMGEYITILEQEVDKLELRQCWLVTLVLWEEQVQTVRRQARLVVQEPVTASEYQALQLELDEEWAPVAELAELLVDGHQDWGDADFETLEDWPEPVITDAAWERVRAEEERQLRKEVAAGTLAGKGRGAGLQVRIGEFNAWSGLESTPVPEDLLQYRVLPDEEAKEVELERTTTARLLDALDWRPLQLKDDPEEPRAREVIAGHLRTGLAEAFDSLWQAMCGVDLVLNEVALEFEGADPLRPRKREALEVIRGRLQHLARELIYLEVELALPEPDEELLDLLRRMVKLG
jgi:hypothetical protein